MQKKNIKPSDFIKNFSLSQKADLYIRIVDERKKYKKFRFLNNLYDFAKRFYLQYIANPNDTEAERVWKIIRNKRGKTDDTAIVHYLQERFADDYLRKFEYAFLARCLLRSDVEKKIIVDMGGGFSYSTITPVLLNFPNSKIISVDVIDFPRKSKYGVSYVTGDCTRTDLPDNFADVISIISALEHVGLGRYGDKLDPDGDIKAMQEASRILKPGGHLVLTVPYGYPTVVFNLHRIYDHCRISLISRGFKPVLMEYSYMGKLCKRTKLEGKHAVSDKNGIVNSPGGILALFKKL